MLVFNLGLRLDRVGIVFIEMTGKRELSHVLLRPQPVCVNNVRYLTYDTESRTDACSRVPAVERCG